MSNINTKKNKEEGCWSSIKLVFYLLFIMLSFLFAYLGVLQILPQAYETIVLIPTLEAKYVKVESIEVRLHNKKDKIINGRIRGAWYRHYIVGNILGDSVNVKIEMPSPKALGCDTISDIKYDTIFPFFNMDRPVTNKKSIRGLAITSYVVASDSILPIWYPKDGNIDIASPNWLPKEHYKGRLGTWAFRYEKDGKPYSWRRKYHSLVIYLLMIFPAIFFIVKGNKGVSKEVKK